MALPLHATGTMTWNPVENIRHRLARRRYLPRARVTRAGTIARISLGVLALIIATIALLDLRGGDEGAQLADTLRRAGVAPVDLVANVASRHRLVLVADIPGSVAAKRFFADVVARVALGSGVDLVGLEVDGAEQRYIDAYLSTPVEDVGILLGRPRALREHEGLANAYLGIYRQIRKLNDQLGADRRIHVVALDAERWPPDRALPPGELARRFGARDSIMAERVEQQLQLNPRARMLIFVGGLNALHDAGGLVQTGGTAPVEVSWFAARLARLYPLDVFSVLVDAPAVAEPRIRVISYQGTAAGPLLAERYRGEPAAILLLPDRPYPDHPIRFATTPGIRFQLTPDDLQLPQAADAYAYLGQ